MRPLNLEEEDPEAVHAVWIRLHALHDLVYKFLRI
jgi:hypothetical protein